MTYIQTLICLKWISNVVQPILFLCYAGWDENELSQNEYIITCPSTLSIILELLTLVSAELQFVVRRQNTLTLISEIVEESDFSDTVYNSTVIR